MQRVKDPERFLMDLERPIPGVAGGVEVTEADLERDASSFLAFAQAFGVPKPKALGTPSGGDAVVASAPAP